MINVMDIKVGDLVTYQLPYKEVKQAPVIAVDFVPAQVFVDCEKVPIAKKYIISVSSLSTRFTQMPIGYFKFIRPGDKIEIETYSGDNRTFTVESNEPMRRRVFVKEVDYEISYDKIVKCIVDEIEVNMDSDEKWMSDVLVNVKENLGVSKETKEKFVESINSDMLI